jgi:D-3-phosphoglycerate dehydrogenase
MVKKVLIIDEVHSSMAEGLQSLGFQVDEFLTLSKQETMSIISQYSGLILRSKFTLDADFIDSASHLTFIARAGAGLDLIDLAACQENNIHVFSANEGNKDAVAEHVMGQLLTIAHHLNTADTEVRNGIWNREANRGWEIHGKTIGIIGFGNMGHALCQRLLGFGVKILAYDKYVPAPSPFWADLADIFQHADIVSLHVPLTEETNGLVNQDFLRSFKKNIVLMNSSRGPITPLENVLWGLQQGIISGLALDVLPNEKIKSWSHEEQILFDQIKSYPNTLFSPHVAGWTTESYLKINTVLIEKIRTLFHP